MKCINCGYKFEEQVSICSNCGNSISNNIYDVSSKLSIKKIVNIILIGLVLVVVVFAIYAGISGVIENEKGNYKILH